MIDIVEVKAAVRSGDLAVRVHNGVILLGCPKAGEWVKIGEVEEAQGDD